MKPEYLYRGIKIRYDMLKDFKFSGVDIIPLYQPLFDEYGRRTVKDGNEYGIYMTDNFSMVKSAYGAVHFNDGTPIRKDIKYGNTPPTTVNIPAVGIIYKINTKGMEIRKPWISSHLTGHYNNGFGGDEWITDIIPKQNYVICSLTIGKDILHDEEQIPIDNIEEAEEILKKRMEQRKYRLELLIQELKKLTVQKRFQLLPLDMEIFKDIYGDDGVKHIDSDNIEINNAKDFIKYLFSIFYRQNREQLDFVTLKYIHSLKRRLNNEDDVDKLLQLIQFDIVSNANSRQSFIQKKQNIGDIPNTRVFDEKEKMYNKVFDALKLKQDSLTQNFQQKNDYEEILRKKYGYYDMKDEEQKKFDEKVSSYYRITKIKNSKKLLMDIKSEIVRRISKQSLEDIANDLNLDLNELFTQQEIIEIQQANLEQMENIENSGRKII